MYALTVYRYPQMHNFRSVHNWNSYPLCFTVQLNSINAELNAICYLLALLGAHRILHFSRIRIKDSKREHFVSYLQITTKTKRTITVLHLVFNLLRTKLYLSDLKDPVRTAQ